MTGLPFSHPELLWPTAALALLVLALGLRAQLRPGLGVRVVGQRPLVQALGLALVLGGCGLGLAEPRWGAPEVPRVTIHVVLDASRSMLVADQPGGASRWQAALAVLDRLWSRPNPGVRFSLDLLTGDSVPVLPPGEDQRLLQDALRAVQPGAIGSPGTALGWGLPQAAALAEPRLPAALLLLSDGEETVEAPEAALNRAAGFLKGAGLPLYAIPFGGPLSQPVPEPAPAPGQAAPGQAAPGQAAPGQAAPGAPAAPVTSTARPDLLRRLAEATGGRLLDPADDLGQLCQDLARGRAPMPVARSLSPGHPEWGAWLALAGLALWLLAAGRPMRAWRPILGLALALGPGRPARAGLPVPQSIQAWAAQAALDRDDLARARRWRPRGDAPAHRLLAAEIDLRSGALQGALDTLAPLTGQGAPRPLPPWRAPALLMAARALVQLDRPEDARALLERLLLEQPGQPEACHNLQSLLKDPAPPPPPQRKPPPPPPEPSQGARQDELDGLRQRLPGKVRPAGGIKDI